jgi:Glycosyltransferase family 87
LLVALLVWLILGPVFLFTQSPDLRDFQTFYASAHAWLSGQDLYASTGQNMNPPAFVVLTAPLALLPMRASLVVWWILNAIAAVAALRLVMRETGLRIGRGHVLVALGFAGTKTQVFLGQTAWLLMLPATLGWRAYRRGQQWRAGAWWGLAIALKPILLPVVAGLAWRKQYRAVAGALAAGAAVSLFGLLGGGVAGYRAWLNTGHNVYWFFREMNGSILGFLSRVGLAPSPRFALWVALSAVVVAATWYRRRRHADPDADTLTWVLVSLLVAPLGWVYYVPLAVGPLVAVSARRGFPRWSWIGLAPLFWPPGLLWSPQDATQTPVVVASLYGLGVLVLWWLATGARAKQPAEQRATHGESAPALPEIAHIILPQP